MKPVCTLVSSIALILSAFALQTSSPVPAPNRTAAQLKTELRTLAAVAERIAQAPTNEEKVRGWLELNRQAKKFGDEMNVAFPHITVKGDKIFPPQAQQLAQAATSYGVRVDFCEMGGNWAADNQGYLKYLELWPAGPEADEATWMGPMGNASFCGDFEGSVEELKETIALHNQFLERFPNSRFAAQAKEELTQSQEQLAQTLKSAH